MPTKETGNDSPQLVSTGNPPILEADIRVLADLARNLVRNGERRILGIAGPPGAGKSTLCNALLEELGDVAVVVGMDGFHLANEELVRLGRRDRKGAPDTFDIDGYASMLHRLRHQKEETIYAPLFDRGIEESIAGAIPIHTATQLVITEGNYLLHSSDGWSSVRALLDQSWFLEVDQNVREERLIARRLSYGDPLAEATAWVRDVDNANAAIIEPSRSRADLIVRILNDPA